jgi:hypothetical protein
MDDDRGIRLDANAIAQHAPTKAAAVSWPFPVDRRLDQLVELANAAGAGTRRNELAAALIASASPTPDDLLQTIVAFRRQRVRDVVLNVDDSAQVVDHPRYRPGRRRQA